MNVAVTGLKSDVGTFTTVSPEIPLKILHAPAGDIITINEGGDYGIAAAYTMTATILNDDGEDCLNGGNTYQLSNNNVGNTALIAGTYHKSLLETNGKVVAPTTVNLKGAKSIVMQPGFEVKAGSTFRADIEGCPQVLAA